MVCGSAVGVELEAVKTKFKFPGSVEICVVGGQTRDTDGCFRPYAQLSRTTELGHKSIGGKLTLAANLKLWMRAEKCDRVDLDPFVDITLAFPCFPLVPWVCKEHAAAFHFFGEPGYTLWPEFGGNKIPDGMGGTDELPGGSTLIAQLFLQPPGRSATRSRSARTHATSDTK